MKKFRVCVGTQETWYHYFDIEARDEEEAQRLVEEEGEGDHYHSKQWDTNYRDVMSVEEIGKNNRRGK